MAAIQAAQFDLFGGVDEAQTVAAVPPMLAAQRWQMPEAEAFVAALRRGALNDAVAVLNRLKINTAWKVLLETGFEVGGTTSRAEMMAPVQRDIIEAAQRRMTGHELRNVRVAAPVAERGDARAAIETSRAAVSGVAPPEGVYATMSAFVQDTQPFGVMADFAARMAGMRANWDSHGKTLGEVLGAIMPAAEQNWRIELEMSDPGFAMAYRSAFNDVRSVVAAMHRADAEFPALRILERIRGPWALDAIHMVAASGPSFGFSRERLKNYVEDSRPYANVKALGVGRNSSRKPAASVAVDEQEVPAASYRYAMVNRPAGIGTVPKGFIRLEDRSAVGQAHYDYARHGVAVYDHRLTDAETKSFEMAPMLDGEERAVVADSVAAALGEYAEGYIEIASQDFGQFEQTVHERLRATAQGYPPSVGDMAVFAAMVRDRLAEHVVAHVPIDDVAERRDGLSNEALLAGWADMSERSRRDAIMGALPKMTYGNGQPSSAARRLAAAGDWAKLPADVKENVLVDVRLHLRAKSNASQKTSATIAPSRAIEPPNAGDIVGHKDQHEIGGVNMTARRMDFPRPHWVAVIDENASVIDSRPAATRAELWDKLSYDFRAIGVDRWRDSLGITEVAIVEGQPAARTFEVMERGQKKTYSVDVKSEAYSRGLSAATNGYMSEASDRWAAVRFHNYCAGYEDGKVNRIAPQLVNVASVADTPRTAAEGHFDEASRLMTEAIRHAGDGERQALRSAFWAAETAAKAALETGNFSAAAEYAKQFPKAFAYLQSVAVPAAERDQAPDENTKIVEGKVVNNDATLSTDAVIPRHEGVKHVEVFVPNERLGAFQRKLATIQTAARKLGLPEWDVTLAPKEWREVSVLRGADDGQSVWEKMRQEGTPVTIEGRAPVVAGWRFLAKIEHEGDGNLVKRMGGDDQSAKSWHTCPPNCAHCNVPRQRNNTFMLQNTETGDTKQVGSTCVSDFLGENYRDPERIAALYDHLADLGREFLYDPDREDGDVDLSSLGVPASRVMAATLAIVEKDKGYISAEKGESERVASTGERVRAAFWSKNTRDAVKVETGHVERAGEVVDWLKGQTDAGSLWLRNIAFLANRECVSAKNAGLFASGYVAWNRELQNSLKAARGTGDWIGQTNEKIKVAATLERMGGFETQYGYKSVLTFRDEVGNALVWKTTAAPGGVVVGGNYHLMATVKDHAEYKGEKQTEIIRAKLPELELFSFGAAKSYAAMAAVATPDVVDVCGHTPLVMALWNDKVDHAKMLLANGADANQRMDGALPALAYATSVEMATALIGAGARAADVDEKDVEQMVDGAREVVRAALGAGVEVEGEQKVLGAVVEVGDNGRYIGAVVGVEGGKVIQDAGRGVLVAHTLSAFANAPEIGAALDIQYSGRVMKAVREMGEGRGVGVVR